MAALSLSLIVSSGTASDSIAAHPQSRRGTLRTDLVPADQRHLFPDSGHSPLSDAAAKDRFMSRSHSLVQHNHRTAARNNDSPPHPAQTDWAHRR